MLFAMFFSLYLRKGARVFASCAKKQKTNCNIQMNEYYLYTTTSRGTTVGFTTGGTHCCTSTGTTLRG